MYLLCILSFAEGYETGCVGQNFCPLEYLLFPIVKMEVFFFIDNFFVFWFAESFKAILVPSSSWSRQTFLTNSVVSFLWNSKCFSQRFSLLSIGYWPLLPILLSLLLLFLKCPEVFLSNFHKETSCRTTDWCIDWNLNNGCKKWKRKRETKDIEMKKVDQELRFLLLPPQRIKTWQNRLQQLLEGGLWLVGGGN